MSEVSCSTKMYAVVPVKQRDIRITSKEMQEIVASLGMVNERRKAWDAFTKWSGIPAKEGFKEGYRIRCFDIAITLRDK